MKELNPCIASGCLGNCCKDINFELTNSERKRIFPYAVKVKNLGELNKVPTDHHDVYFSRIVRRKFKGENMVEVAIVGRCPHLKYDGNCRIHDKRSYAARNFQIGSDECNKIRICSGLPIISPDNPIE